MIGLPGNPLSGLVVFRLVGAPLVWSLAGCEVPPPEPSIAASLTRDVPSEAGRRDVVQVRLDAGQAYPLFGRLPCCRCSPAPTGTSWCRSRPRSGCRRRGVRHPVSLSWPVQWHLGDYPWSFIYVKLLLKTPAGWLTFGCVVTTGSKEPARTSLGLVKCDRCAELPVSMRRCRCRGASS